MSEDQLTFAGTRNAFDRAPFRTVLLTPTDRVLRVVRRSEPAASGHWFCPLTGNAHVAETVVTSSVRTSSPVDLALDELPDAQPPDQCACGRSFGAAAVTEGFDAAEWRRSDTGALVTLATAPLGAVWEVDWLPLDYHPPGDRYVWIRVPGSDWSPDAPAANCPLDDHFQAEHHCWVRSGPPSRLTVGKDGATCDAGMGSIATPIWHGLVRDGWVISAPIIGDYPSEALVAAQTDRWEKEFLDPPPGLARVTVWGENVHDHRNPHTRALYSDGMHSDIAAGIRQFLSEEQAVVRTATLDQAEHGLTEEVLDTTDVLVWWGHVAHDQVSDDVVDKVCDRLLQGRLGLVVLHSGHFSKPFRRLMGTTCTLRWREADDREVVWTVAPTHPVAQGLPQGFEIPASEMYGEYFDIPEPDDLVFLSTFSGGEVFRSGCGFRRGKGRIFYFSPGHETYPIYHQAEVRRVIANAVAWVQPGPVPPVRTDDCVQSPVGWYRST